MKLSAIFAADKNNGIGINNQLLCHLPGDLKFFKSSTMGSPIVMGRKTYESIGRLLPGRKNIIITRNSNYRIEGAEIYHSLESALASCTEENVFIIGGAEIFKQALPQITEVYRTEIQHSFAADAFFELPQNEFKKVWEECHTKDEKNAYDYCFQKWTRNVE